MDHSLRFRSVVTENEKRQPRHADATFVQAILTSTTTSKSIGTSIYYLLTVGSILRQPWPPIFLQMAKNKCPMQEKSSPESARCQPPDAQPFACHLAGSV
ncbi:MAG: hypothetical protein AB7T07_05545 [Steroidobacteraceae bacterium]